MPKLRDLIRLIALSIVLVFALSGCSPRTVTGSQKGEQEAKQSGEIWLTNATDPGQNPFMTSVAPPPPKNLKPGPKLKQQGDAKKLIPQTQPGDQEGLYGGTMKNSECDREKMIAFLKAHPPEAKAFVAALNADKSLSWSKGKSVKVEQIPDYIRELTPAILRVDTRVTNHGFDGTKPTPMQSVLQAGTAVLVDNKGVPRARCFCGNPLTAPIALKDSLPAEKGARWTGFNPGIVVVTDPSTTDIKKFALVDVVSGAAFDRPAGSNGEQDTAAAGPSPGSNKFDSAYSGNGITVTVEKGRVVRLTETIGGTGCALKIELDFAVADETGAFAGPWTSNVTSGDCTGATGTMDGNITGTTMTLRLVNQSVGRTFNDILERSRN